MRTGRPRLDDQEGFKEAFATVLPVLRSGGISRGEAARRLGISHRSLSRYLRLHESREPSSQSTLTSPVNVKTT